MVFETEPSGNRVLRHLRQAYDYLYDKGVSFIYGAYGQRTTRIGVRLPAGGRRV